MREGGSGHAGTTNSFRQSGLGAGVLVLILDFAKGFIPVYLALRFGQSDWAIMLAGTMAVVGHCWPLFGNFRGGMGLATAGGSILAVYPLGLFIAAGILIFFTLVLRHSAKAAVVSAFVYAPIYFWLSASTSILWMAVGISAVLAYRFYGDWNREYRELWLDREKVE